MGRIGASAMLLMGAVLVSLDSADAHRQMTPWVRVAQSDQQQCPEPWQTRDQDGNCVDPPGLTPHGAGYQPGPGEMCWAHCECYEGQSPAADNCAPCSFLGLMCVPQ